MYKGDIVKHCALDFDEDQKPITPAEVSRNLSRSLRSFSQLWRRKSVIKTLQSVKKLQFVVQKCKLIIKKHFLSYLISKKTCLS